MEWIPAKDKMPKALHFHMQEDVVWYDSDPVHISVKRPDGSTFIMTAHLCRKAGEEYWVGNDNMIDDAYEVLAWMPIPE